MSTEKQKNENRMLRNYKDNWAIDRGIPGVDDWSSYISWCKSNAFDEGEIGYDDLILDYVQFRLENQPK